MFMALCIVDLVVVVVVVVFGGGRGVTGRT